MKLSELKQGHTLSYISSLTFIGETLTVLERILKPPMKIFRKIHVERRTKLKNTTFPKAPPIPYHRRSYSIRFIDKLFI